MPRPTWGHTTALARPPKGAGRERLARWATPQSCRPASATTESLRRSGALSSAQAAPGYRGPHIRTGSLISGFRHVVGRGVTPLLFDWSWPRGRVLADTTGVDLRNRGHAQELHHHPHLGVQDLDGAFHALLPTRASSGQLPLAPESTRKAEGRRRLHAEIGEGLRVRVRRPPVAHTDPGQREDVGRPGTPHTLWALYLLRPIAMSATTFGVVPGIGALGAAARTLATPSIAARYGPGPMMLAALAISPLTTDPSASRFSRPRLPVRHRRCLVPSACLCLGRRDNAGPFASSSLPTACKPARRPRAAGSPPVRGR